MHRAKTKSKKTIFDDFENLPSVPQTRTAQFLPISQRTLLRSLSKPYHRVDYSFNRDAALSNPKYALIRAFIEPNLRSVKQIYVPAIARAVEEKWKLKYSPSILAHLMENDASFVDRSKIHQIKEWLIGSNYALADLMKDPAVVLRNVPIVLRDLSQALSLQNSTSSLHELSEVTIETFSFVDEALAESLRQTLAEFQTAGKSKRRGQRQRSKRRSKRRSERSVAKKIKKSTGSKRARTRKPSSKRRRKL